MLTVLPWFLEKVGGGGGGECLCILYPVYCWRAPARQQPLLYPAGSWFLLRQTREKALWATICFSIKHARVRQAPRDTFDVNFICQFIFCLKCLYKRMQISCQKRWQKNECIYLVCGLHIKPKFKAFLPSLVRVCWARWTQHSRPSSKQLFKNKTVDSRFVRAPSNDWTSSKLKTEARRRIPVMYSTRSLEESRNVFLPRNPDSSSGLGLWSLHSGLA